MSKPKYTFSCVMLRVNAVDNHGIKYPVMLDVSDPNRFEVRIQGTPVHWALADIINHTSNEISIDLGQGWTIMNVQAIISDAKAMLVRNA